MPKIFVEGKGRDALTFEFADRWQVFKYDAVTEGNFYNTLKCHGYKAVDFVGISKNTLMLMEVKYVRADNQRSSLRFIQQDSNFNAIVQSLREKSTPQELNSVNFKNKRPYLIDEVDKKVRDTLLGLFANCRRNNQKPSNLPLCNQDFLINKLIFVILFLERSEELNQPEVFKPMALDIKLALEQRLSVLGNIRVDVVNTLTMPPALGITVST